jgi:ABC-2 type transport system ATP-binding protein
VVLSTHIVEDVAVLCSRFAVIKNGRLVTVTSPSEAKASIAGKIWEGAVTGPELEEIQKTRRVTQAILVEGRNRVRIHEPNGEPPGGFERVPPTLEDAYFVLMKSGNGAGTVAP